MSESKRNKKPWVFLDIGNVLWSDDEGDLFTLEQIGRELVRVGKATTNDERTAAMHRSIEAFAPSCWRAVVWSFVSPDRRLYDSVSERVKQSWDGIPDDLYHSFTQPFAGVSDMLAELSLAGYQLALASNNAPRALRRLDELDLLRYFSLRDVSETLGLAKPDLRFFMTLLHAAACEAEDVVMVGDRLCNDISPTRLLGIKTIRVLKGWHAKQQARTPLDLPDLNISEPREIPAALKRLEI